MKAVLMSVKPEWWEKILSGKKILEIRKTHPQSEELYWPITVLVYVSGTGAVQGKFICPGEASEHSPRDLAGPSCVPEKPRFPFRILVAKEIPGQFFGRITAPPHDPLPATDATLKSLRF